MSRHGGVAPALLADYRAAHHAYASGRLKDALQLLEELVARAPGFAEAWNLLGVVSDMRNDPVVASRAFFHAVKLRPDPGTHINLGQSLQKLGRLEQAAACYTAALEIDPRGSRAWLKLASVEEQRGRPQQALRAYQHAVALAPDDPRAIGDALSLRRAIAEWDATIEDRWIEAYLRADQVDSAPLPMLALAGASPAMQLQAASSFASSQWGRWHEHPPIASRPAPLSGRPLRVGYVSSDFREHALAYLLLDVIQAHDRSRVIPMAYALPPGTDDAWRARARIVFDEFIDLAGLDDDAMAARIAADAPDILVDLNGYTRHARPGVFARRPCTIQMAWLGYVGSLGNRRQADYIIGDPVVTPVSDAVNFAETLALMPHCFQPNGWHEPLGPPPSRASLGLPEDSIVLGCFNQTFKLHASLWDDWCRILRSVADAVLWLAEPSNPLAAGRLRDEARLRGVDGARLVFAPHQPRESHLDRLQAMDIALDTYPYNGGTTTSDALRAGVPLFAFAGRTFAGRMSASLLRASGLGEHVLKDQESVVREVVRLASDHAALHAVRQRVGELAIPSRLFDAARFARELEALFAAVHCRALTPEVDPTCPVVISAEA